MTTPNPYILAAENSPSLIPLLRSNPSLASAQDDHGYSLLHAAASYGHLDLLRALVNEFKVDVNLKDEDGETCLFVAETVEVARCLIEELGVDTAVKNEEGLTAENSIVADGSFPPLGTYLSGLSPGGTQVGSSVVQPDLPPNVKVTYGSVPEQPNVDDMEVDPEFRRRIEELASKENFHSEEGQQELRALVTDAIRGVSGEGQERDVKRRLE